MRVSAKAEYACLAVLELAAHYGTGEPVRIGKIADEHGIPSRFLVQILLQLKGAGFVASTRGASGGYQLVKSPEDISLGQIMTVIEGDETSSVSSGTGATSRVLRSAWQEVGKAQRDKLNSITFGELVARVKRGSANMYYI